MKRLGALVFGLFCLFGLIKTAAADDTALAEGYCNDMEASINLLADYTTTMCLPSKGTTGLTFLFLSSEAVLSKPEAKKAWLITVVAVVGHTLNEATTITDEVIVSDVETMQQRISYRMPASTAQKLQRQVKANQLDIESMYREVLNVLQEHHIPK